MANDNRNSGTRQDTWLITISLGAHRNWPALSMGAFDKKTGGDMDSDATQYFPGGMKTPRNLGGRKTVTNLVLTREYDRDDDGPLRPQLRAYVGVGPITFMQQALDKEGNPYGKQDVYQGILKRFKMPDVDASASGLSELELEVMVEGYPTVQ